MRYGRYAYSYIFLRVGLGLTFLWIGIDMFRSPDAWIGFMPQNVPGGFSREGALTGAAVFDAVLGLLLLTDNFPRVTAFLVTLHLAGIIAVQGIDAVLIRDVGLLGAALALLAWPHRRRKHWLAKLFGRKGGGGDED